MPGKKRTKNLSRTNARIGLMFSLPFIIGFVFLFLVPIFQSILMSFRTVSASEKGINMPFIGALNYFKLLFEDVFYLPELEVSFTNLAMNFPCIIMFSFFIAIILNQKFRGRTVARAVFFLPVIIFSGVIQLIQDNHLQQVTLNAISSEAASESGALQLTKAVMDLIGSIRLNSAIISFVTGAVSRVYTITVSSGIQILIFLAGLQTIPPSIYEASSMEGATGWENFWKITFPVMSPIILVNSVYTIIDLMTGMVNPVMLRIYNTSIVNGSYGYAAAMSWIYFIILIVILSIFMFFTSKKVYYED